MLTTLFLFLAVLVTLVMIHEFGHYAAAKICGMRVEEFAFGFPPRLFSKKIGETEYSINMLPIGGYVKITGESFDEKEREKNKNDIKAFQNKNRLAQVFVLSAGIIMNLILAFAIFAFTNTGEEYIKADDINYSSYIKNPKIIVSSVSPNSPSKTAGITSGDEVLEFRAGGDIADLKSVASVIDLVKRNNESDIKIVFKKENGEVVTSTVRAVFGVTPDRKSIGMGVIYAEKVKLSFLDSVKKGFFDTKYYTVETVKSYYDLFAKLFTGNNVLSSLSGPVGIAKAVGNASQNNLDHFLSFVALLSINLAVFNALPLPALDGGRILFVLYESISRRKINMNFQYYTNLLGFIFLIGLMLTVTFFDIFK